MESFGLVKIINLFPDELERNDYLEGNQLFSPPEENDSKMKAGELSLTWEEFNKAIIENSCCFQYCDENNLTNQGADKFSSDHDKSSKSPIKYLLMIDNLDMFDTMGKNYYSIHKSCHPIALISHCLNMINSIQSPSQASSIPVNLYSPSSEASEKESQNGKGNIIASLIVYARRPSEIQLQLPNMTFHSSASSSLPYVVNASNDRYCNGPFLQAEQQPLLSEYLKYR
jgi:hypothetical protein